MANQIRDDATGYRGSFQDIEAAERAFCRLQANGFRDDCISLLVDDDCPACAVERSGMEDPVADRVIARGQGAGAIAGSALGFLMVGWPGTSIASDGLLEGFASLCVVGAWALSGAILGALAGAAITELPFRRRDGRPPHRHYVLVLRPPEGTEARAIAVLRDMKARLEGEAALEGTRRG